MGKQYIGARYVPKFSDVNGGVWNNSYSYEPMTIVKHGNDYYISKKPVPVGADITNNNYWILTGNYNGAIADLQTRVNALEGDVDTLETGYNYLDLNRLVEWKDRVILFLADSYQVMTNYCEAIAEYVGCTDYVIRAKSGAGFYREPGSGMPYETYWYQNILTNLDPLSASEKAKITDVVILATANDNQTDGMDLVTAMRNLNTWFNANLPKLRHVHLRSCGWGNGSTAYEVSQLRVTNCLFIYSNIAPAMGWSYVDCTRVMKTCMYFDTSSDGRHPTTAGANQIARAVANSLMVGSCTWTSAQNVFGFIMTLPSEWSGASITSPSNGVLKVEAFMDANGVYYWRCNQEIAIAHIPLTTSASNYNIELTPTTLYANPFPVHYRTMLNFYSGLRDNAIKFCELARTDDSHTRIVVNGSLDSAGETALRIRFKSDIIGYCNRTGVV